ncbi:hypothetical protein JVT61DRAFT_11563 [Boletus reticuloceps]|uniref:Uncharacterized protein n=1 Tax=Boletus reticuloceps TaxID=495285 RepID=A0A8I3ABG4_9AGAM|nr:hypothetical protein JVT61DRAFT_11563 [Boletus reticuloceps]
MSSRKDIRQIKCPSNDLDCYSLSPSQAPPPPYSSSTSNSLTTTTSTVSTHSSTSSPTDSSSSTTPTKSPAVAAVSSKSNAGPIAGGVIGGVVLLVLLVLGALLYLRARKRNRTPPSSEFLNSIKAGAPPVLRLGSGAEYTPTLSEKGGAYTHYPPCPPPPFTPNPYTSSPMLDTKFPDEIMVTDIPSGRPSVELPLHPQRFSAQHRPSTSIGSRRELWGSQGELSPVRLSPANTDSVLHFAPRFSLDDDPPPSQFSHSPPSLHPLRRQPDPDT